MKFRFSKKFQTVYDFTQNFYFFLTGLLCFSSKSLYPESMTAAMLMFTLPKRKGLLECLYACQISHGSKFSHFNVINQSHLLLSKNDIHQLLPYIFKRQAQTAHQLSLLLQAALVQINEGLYFRSSRLATRFESNAVNIAKVRVKALLNLIIKINNQENQVVKNCQDHIYSVFSSKSHCQNDKNTLR